MPSPRFTLHRLLIVVAACAVAITAYPFSPNAVLNSEYRAVRLGMTPEEVRSILGEPYHILRFDQRSAGGRSIHGELWWFADPWWVVPKYGSTQCNLTFVNGKVAGVRASP